MRLKKRSLREVMQSLAQMLPGYWEPLDHNRGYTLTLSASASLSRQKWWNLFLSERERTLAERRAMILQQMREDWKPAQQQFNITPEMNAEMKERHGFFQLLPSSVQESLAAQMNEMAFMGLKGVPFGTGDMEGAIIFPLETMPPSLQQFVRKYLAGRMQKDESEVDWKGTSVSVVNGGTALLAYVTMPNGPYFGTPFSTGIRTNLDQEILTLHHPWIVDAVKMFNKSVPEAWKRLAIYQQSRVWQNDSCPDLPDGRPIPRKSDVLDWIGRQAEIEYVADYHSLGGSVLSEAEKAQPLKRPLKTELDYQARDLDMSWKKQASEIYLFRNNRWYRDDFVEVPAPLVRRWLTTETPYSEETPESKEAGATLFTRRLKRWMAREAEFATSLTIWQLTAGLPFVTQAEGDALSSSLKRRMQTSFGSKKDDAEESPPKALSVRHFPGMEYPLWQESGYILHNLHLVLFYASLNEGGRTALLENRLHIDQLSPSQLQQAIYMLPKLSTVLAQSAPETVVIGLGGQTTEKSPITQPIVGKLMIVSPRSE